MSDPLAGPPIDPHERDRAMEEAGVRIHRIWVDTLDCDGRAIGSEDHGAIWIGTPEQIHAALRVARRRTIERN